MKKPIIESIEIKWKTDVTPDVSYLDGCNDHTNPENWKHVSTAKVWKAYRREFGGSPRYNLFPGRLAAIKELGRLYADKDQERLNNFYEGYWEMQGCTAEAVVSYPTGNRQDRRLEWLTSSGLWGIESDSDQAYKRSVAEEELHQLHQHLKQFNVSTKGFRKLAADALEQM